MGVDGPIGKDETLDSWTPLEWARYYYSQGLCVIPSKDGKPKVDWKHYHEDRVRPSEEQVEAWFRGESFRSLQIYVICGQVSGVVVLDCDSPEADEWWRELLGSDVLDSTACSLSGSGRGHHYWFRLGDEPQESRAAHRGTMKWDLRGEGGGVVVPASPHRSGGRYTWVRPLDSGLMDWPYPDIPGRGSQSIEGDSTANSLAWLLQNPGEGGRNNWVTAVLGHYAKNLRFEDGYRATAELIWSLIEDVDSDHPYTRDEFDATIESVWSSEKRKTEVADEDPTEHTGFLAAGGDCIYTLCRRDKTEFLAKWSNFDVRVDSLIEDSEGRVTYLLDATLSLEGDTVEKRGLVLPGEKLGSPDQFSRWLSSQRMITFNPAGDAGIKSNKASRFQMYLEAQEPRVLRSSPWMGWYDDAELGSRYVTQVGLIDATGLVPVSKVGLVPDPRKQGSGSQWFYGFDPEDQARATLREVLTYHDPVAVAVFGSVWSLAPIKGAVMRASSLFPHLAIIAPSEAGKTNGFFDLMLQANGRLAVGGTYTAASLRDDLARHRGGFVWIDDPANIDDLGDLLRAAAGEGVHSRKGGNNWVDTIQTHLVAPIVLSAEGLEMLKERAMADRVIQVHVPSPTGRESRYGEYRQWDDITELMNRVGHLSRFAGNYVQRSFQWFDAIGGIDGLRRMTLDLRLGTGRMAEKLALVRAGARCLQYVIGEWDTVEVDGLHIGGGEAVDIIGIVDAWAEGEAKESRVGPYLVSVVMPAYLADRGYVPSFKAVPNDPVFLDSTGFLRVNIPSLAQWWVRHSRSRTDRDRAQQLGALNALRSEAQMLEWTAGSPMRGKRYHIVDIESTRKILEEAGYSLEEAQAMAKEGT